MAKKNILPFSHKDEIITYSKINPYSSFVDRIDNPDKVLEKNGGRVDGELLDIYDRILRKDAHLYSLFQTRKHTILSKPFEILPASEDKRDIEICDFIKYQLFDKINNFNQDLYELLKAFDYGFAVAEYLFTVENSRLIIDKIKFKHPNNFVFDKENRLCLYASEKQEALPQDKFIIHRHNYSDTNPYGESLISERLYWLYYFKTNILSFLVHFIERFGSPVPILKYHSGASDAEKKVLEDIISGFHDEMAMIVPEGVVAELLEWKTSGNRAIHEDAISLINGEMSKAVLGQTLTSETKDTGSRAQAQVHLDVLANIVRFDCHSLAATINDQLIRRLVDWNFASGRYPTLKFKTEPEKDLKALAERDEILVRMGVKLPAEYFAKTYNIPVEEALEKAKEETIEKAEENKDREIEEEELEDFAEEDIDEDSLVARQAGELDKYLDKALSGVINAQEKFNITLKKLLESSSSLKEVKNIDKDIFRGDIEPLAKALTGITFWAYLLGRAHILEHEEIADFAEVEDFSFMEAVNYFKNKVPLTHDELLSDYEKLYEKSFYIALVNDKRLVESVHSGITKALEEGSTFYEFKKNVNSYFDKAGVTRLNPYHLETVFRTNTASAYAEGRRQQMLDPDTRNAFPYWRYSAVMDRRTRSSHKALHGLILPSDSQRWADIYPPGGFRCRCLVIPVNKRYFARKGIPEPKDGELTFVYSKNDAKLKTSITNQKAIPKKGKRGWSTETVKEDSFVFPKSEFKKKKDFFKIDKKIHGEPGGFGIKNRIKKPYPTKIVKGEELPVLRTRSEWKALIDDKTGNYSFEKKAYKGIEISLQKRSVQDYRYSDIKGFIKKVRKNNSNYLDNLRKINYIGETVRTYEQGIVWHNYGWYDNDNKEIYVFNKGNLDKDYILKHELGHHVYYEFLEKSFGDRIQTIPDGNEKITDIIMAILDGNRKKALVRLQYQFGFSSEEVKRIDQLL